MKNILVASMLLACFSGALYGANNHNNTPLFEIAKEKIVTIAKNNKFLDVDQCTLVRKFIREYAESHPEIGDLLQEHKIVNKLHFQNISKSTKLTDQLLLLMHIVVLLPAVAENSIGQLKPETRKKIAERVTTAMSNISINQLAKLTKKYALLHECSKKAISAHLKQNPNYAQEYLKNKRSTVN